MHFLKVFVTSVTFWGALTLFVSAPSVRADVVTLNSGGSVHGNLLSPATGSNVKSVAVVTSNGTLVVFDKDEVKQVKRGADPAQKAAAKAKSKKQLTTAERAWFPKIHGLLNRLASSDRDVTRKARVDLLNIDDPDAIPALTEILRNSRDENMRRLYVAILKNIRSPRVIYYLVDQSLFDPSPQVREDARKAIGPDRADMARPLYIHSLRLREAEIASRAALALLEIGDPRGEAVPYLIDTLVCNSRMKHMVSPEQITVNDFMTYYTTPGYNPNALGEIWLGQTSGSSTMPVYLGPPGMSQAQINAAVANLKPATPQSLKLAALPQNRPMDRGPGTYYITPAVADTYAVPVFGRVPAKYSRAPVLTENPTVLDALVKITDRQHPGYGYNADNWRRFWATEKKNRDGVKPASEDRVLPRDQAAPH